jgi:hypothetical protein
MVTATLGSDDQSSAATSSVQQLVATRPVTRGSRGIVNSKQYTDGLIRWCLSATTEEPTNLQVALNDSN